MNIFKDLKVYSQYANPLTVVLFSKGFHAMLAYRIGYCLSKAKILTPISFLLSRIIQILYGIDIHWRAEIAGGCRIVHGYGLVIAAGVKIGKNCSLYQGVTIGSKGEWTTEKMPVLGNSVTLYAGAKVFGAVKLADNVVVGANAVVAKSLAEKGAVYGGIPARKIKK